MNPLIYTIKEVALTLGDMFGNLGKKISSSTSYVETFLNVATEIQDVLTRIFVAIDIPSLLSKVVSILSSLASIVKKVFSSVYNFLKEMLI